VFRYISENKPAMVRYRVKRHYLGQQL